MKNSKTVTVYLVLLLSLGTAESTRQHLHKSVTCTCTLIKMLSSLSPSSSSQPSSSPISYGRYAKFFPSLPPPLPFPPIFLSFPFSSSPFSSLPLEVGPFNTATGTLGSTKTHFSFLAAGFCPKIHSLPRKRWPCPTQGLQSLQSPGSYASA